jgi:hypothetical protein
MLPETKVLGLRAPPGLRAYPASHLSSVQAEDGQANDLFVCGIDVTAELKCCYWTNVALKSLDEALAGSHDALRSRARTTVSSRRSLARGRPSWDVGDTSHMNMNMMMCSVLYGEAFIRAGR